MLRQPIIVVLGHVDHGKTSLLDRIRKTIIASKEAGGITQAIGSTQIPIDIVTGLCEKLLKKFNIKITIPGLLFVDTPGHAAFTTLRKRGGSIADLAILVVDINEGLMPQTIESLGILRDSKVPFVIAVNKIDRLMGWVEPDSELSCFSDNFDSQPDDVKGDFEKKFYELMNQLQNQGFNAERFDRIQDFTKNIAAIPVSAKTGEGIPELLTLLAGLAQQFLKDSLVTTENAKGSILEVKEITGLGTTIDVIIYDGTVHKGDYLVCAGMPITKIRALMEPAPLRDMRTEKKFQSVNSVSAASGVKIVAPELENILSGSEIRIAKSEQEAAELLIELEKEKKEVEVITEKEGLILKADTIGSLEALINIFKKYPIKQATTGVITREDAIIADTNPDMFYKIIIGFNTRPTEDAKEVAKNKNIKLLLSDVIYHLLEQYEKWVAEEKEDIKKKELDAIIRPGKIKLIPGCVFRASNPAIVGCEVIGGIIKPGYKLMKEDKEIGEVKQLQNQGKNMDEAKIGDKIAISIIGPTVGRQIDENDTLLTDLTSNDYKNLIKNEKFLTEHEKTVLEEIKSIKQKKDKMWGML